MEKLSNNPQPYKGTYGWACRSTYPTDKPDRLLELFTMKRFSGHLSTTAKVVKIEGGFTVHQPFSDFSRTIIQELVRVSEKNVKAQHDRAILMVPDLLKEIQK